MCSAAVLSRGGAFVRPALRRAPRPARPFATASASSAKNAEQQAGASPPLPAGLDPVGHLNAEGRLYAEGHLNAATAQLALPAPTEPASPVAERTLSAFLLGLLRSRLRAARRATREAADAAATDHPPALVADGGQRQPAASALATASAAESVRLLRLALRRLRNACRLAAGAGVLRGPSRAAARALSPVLRSLGAPRDAEALSTALLDAAQAAAAAGALAQPEADAVAFALHSLQVSRRSALAGAARAARARPARRAVAALARAAKAAAAEGGGGGGGVGGDDAGARGCAAGRLAVRPAREGAAALLRLQAAALFAHPAWALPTLTTAAAGGVSALAAPAAAPARGLGPGAALGLDPSACGCAHSLRRAARELRYAMEACDGLLAGAGGGGGGGGGASRFGCSLERVREVHSALGACRDAEVAADPEACAAAAAGGGGGGDGDGGRKKAGKGGGGGRRRRTAAAAPRLPRVSALPGVRAALAAAHADGWRRFRAAAAELTGPDGQAAFFGSLAA